ncbi:MAG: GAF domain-containing protein, partial [FCB group bacterium]|nr:GAF domain-containing protein [FCB group bacterium]
MTTDRQQEFFAALLQVSEAMVREKDTRQLLDKILEIAMDVAGAERGFVLVSSLREAGKVIPAISRNIDPEHFLEEDRYSRGVVDQVMQTGEPVITINAETDERFKGRESVVINKLTSIICVPIFHGQSAVGYIYLDSQNRRSRFNMETLEFMKVFATQTGLALANLDFVSQLSLELNSLRSQSSPDYRFSDIIGQSPGIRAVFDITEKVMNTDVPVMILGASGTGKELIARAIHYKGNRAEKPFVAQFCGALTDSLLESELFGYKKGAFTGAVKDKKGLIEVADGGTFFLDEIADVSLDIQTKLLRFIQEGEFRRVGDTQIRTANVRFISATNKDIMDMVKSGRFREDLFYRLNVVTIRIPPLKERKEDIPLLADYFLKTFCERFHRDIKGFTRASMEAMLNHDWP